MNWFFTLAVWTSSPPAPQHCFSWVHGEDFSTDCYPTRWSRDLVRRPNGLGLGVPEEQPPARDHLVGDDAEAPPGRARRELHHGLAAAVVADAALFW